MHSKIVTAYIESQNHLVNEFLELEALHTMAFYLLRFPEIIHGGIDTRHVSRELSASENLTTHTMTTHTMNRGNIDMPGLERGCSSGHYQALRHHLPPKNSMYRVM